jgi:hypothetical protein
MGFLESFGTVRIPLQKVSISGSTFENFGPDEFYLQYFSNLRIIVFGRITQDDPRLKLDMLFLIRIIQDEPAITVFKDYASKKIVYPLLSYYLIFASKDLTSTLRKTILVIPLFSLNNFVLGIVFLISRTDF